MTKGSMQKTDLAGVRRFKGFREAFRAVAADLASAHWSYLKKMAKKPRKAL